MICNKCGHDNTPKRVKRDPFCMYQAQGSEVINKLFDPLKIPDGWYDSPAAAREAILKPVKSEVIPPAPSRKVKKRKVKNGNNSSRPNK